MVVRRGVDQLSSQIIDQEKLYVYLSYPRTISDGADKYFHVLRTADILMSLFQQYLVFQVVVVGNQTS